MYRLDGNTNTTELTDNVKSNLHEMKMSTVWPTLNSAKIWHHEKRADITLCSVIKSYGSMLGERAPNAKQ
jgi:hypothetical protein